MPRGRPLESRLDIIRDLSTELRRGTAIWTHSQALRQDMTWAEARLTPVTNTDWWWLLRPVSERYPDGGPIQLRMPDGTLVERNPRRPNRTTAAVESADPVATTPVFSTGSDLPDFTYGIEIEAVMRAGMTRPRLAQILTDAGVEAFSSGYGHTTPLTGWKLTTDGSIRCHGGRYNRGVEFVSPILRGTDGIESIQKLCAVINAQECHVNASCGLHVHVGAANRPIEWHKRILQIYAENEPAIDSMIAPSRRASRQGFCNSCRVSPDVMAATNLTELRAAYTNTMPFLRHRDTARFRKVNLESLSRHSATGGTIEFRHYQGTTNAKKIEHWVRCVLAIAERAKSSYESVLSPSRNAPPVLEEFLSLIGTPEETTRYLIARRNKFGRVGSRLATAA